tara:strand:+ start:792 stop:1232 length:441 start_codon:yes stop_codon:yes gene_type:complete
MTNKAIKIFTLFTLVLIYNPLFGAGGITKSLSKHDAKVFIIEPKDGQVVHNPINIVFGISNMSLSPAGIKMNYSGHHHLLIDVKKLPDLSKPIPADKNHLHFGKGQSKTSINLKKGQHTLQLLLGDYAHIPHERAVISDKITILVK